MGCTAYMSDDSRRDTRPKLQRVNSAPDLAYLQDVYYAVLISLLKDLVDKLLYVFSGNIMYLFSHGHSLYIQPNLIILSLIIPIVLYVSL